MDIKSRIADVAPSAVVIVATIRALKMQGGVPKDKLSDPDVDAVAAGVENLKRHVGNVAKFGISPVVAINKFATDTPEELQWLLTWCAAEGVEAAVADVWGRGGGGDGGDELAAKVAAAMERPSNFHHLYPLEMSVEDKIRTIVQEIYGADGVEFSVPAQKRLVDIQKNGWAGLPVCMAKTQYSFTDDASKLGAPKGFQVHVRELIPKTGAGFIVALTGAVMTMPGLPKEPAAMRMDVDADGKPTGLF
jgi:formate--tetrahydrofolate ligase